MNLNELKNKFTKKTSIKEQNKDIIKKYLNSPITDLDKKLYNIQMERENTKTKTKFGLGLDIIKEFISTIKNWFIAEYKIIRKLKYALSKKTDEAKIRYLFDESMKDFCCKYGYDRGMKKYYDLTYSISGSISLHKRMKNNGSN